VLIGTDCIDSCGIAKQPKNFLRKIKLGCTVALMRRKTVKLYIKFYQKWKSNKLWINNNVRPDKNDSVCFAK
jgi:hypothetical protein